MRHKEEKVDASEVMVGLKVITGRLFSTGNYRGDYFISEERLQNRRRGKQGIILDSVAGYHGKVWWVEHFDKTTAPYALKELRVLGTLHLIASTTKGHMDDQIARWKQVVKKEPDAPGSAYLWRPEDLFKSGPTSYGHIYYQDPWVGRTANKFLPPFDVEKAWRLYYILKAIQRGDDKSSDKLDLEDALMVLDYILIRPSRLPKMYADWLGGIFDAMDKLG